MLLAAIANQIVVSSARGFVTRWTVAGDATARTITLPLNTGNGSAFNFTVYWGDGTSSVVTSATDTNRIHTYAFDGTYEIEIVGICEGWSFANSGDRLKCVAVVYWGDSAKFAGFRYVAAAFDGCSNLTSLGTGKILKSGTGPTSLSSFARNCPLLVSVQSGIFDNLTAVNTLSQCFSGDSSLVTVPAGIFDALTAVTSTYRLFYNDTALASIPAGLFRYLTLVTDMSYTFWNCGQLSVLPQDSFRYNVEVTTFAYVLYACSSLATVGSNLFRYNTKCTDFTSALQNASKLAHRADMFFASGEEGTRFATSGQINFTNALQRGTFSGSQGTASALWECDYGESMTLDVAPATDWAQGDLITGQTSGAVTEVVSKTSTFVYRVKKHYGTFALGETVGVTGNSSKLAAQGAALPTFANRPTATSCFAGGGNSLTSLSNYNLIPFTPAPAWR